MKRASGIAVFVAGLALITASTAYGQGAGAPADAARKLVDNGQFAEALALVDGALKAGTADPALKMCQLDALLGLHRVMEARQVALANLASGPGFRFKAGVCSAKFGRMAEALDIWKPLYADKEWAEPAYRESVAALLATGKEREAKALLSEALQKVPGSPVSLLNLSLTLDLGAEAAKSAIEKLKAAAPQDAARHDAWAKVYAAAGGGFLQESLEGKLPATVALKEKTERIEASTLSWGGSGATAGGISDTASKEGGKANTMSAPPRVVVEAKLNGERAEPMVVDAATDVVLLTRRVAKKLNLEGLGPSEYAGLGLQAPVQSDWVLLKEIRVGPLTFKNVPALAIDEKTEYWKETGGILPLWLFRNYGIHFDRRRGKLDLLPTGTPPDQALGAGSFQTRVLWYGRRPYLETRIQDKPVCFLLLATNSATTYIEQRRLADIGISGLNPKYGTQQIRGFYGIITSGVADNVTLYVGPTRINLPTVQVADLCPDCGVDCYGVLGRNVLDLFDVYLDYQASVLAFKGYEKGK